MRAPVASFTIEVGMDESDGLADTPWPRRKAIPASSYSGLVFGVLHTTRLMFVIGCLPSLPVVSPYLEDDGGVGGAERQWCLVVKCGCLGGREAANAQEGSS